ncbi:efflux RND transporter permease subunit [Candidatus Sumerlaeota bacterium]
MKRMISFCVNNTVFANVLMALILLAGGFAAATIIREFFPRFSMDMITIAVPYPGASPEEVEEGICLKLEDAIEGLEGVKRYETTAVEGMGRASIELEESADVQEVKDELTDRVNAIVTFPLDAERPMVTEAKFDQMTIGVALAGDLPETQLKELAEDIRDELVDLPEVSQVSVAGARRYEITIELAEEKLRQYALTFDQVSRAVNRASHNLTGGIVRSTQEEIQIRTMGRRYTGEDYANIIVVARPDGTVIRLGQLAEIRDGFQQEENLSTHTDARYRTRPAVALNVFNSEDEDAIEIAEAVKAYVARKNLVLPRDGDGEPIAQLTTYGDMSRMIRGRLSLLIRNGRIGLALVFLLLWIFLDLRLAFWVSLGIPISLAGALALMPMIGLTINMITMFAFIMILGIIVDDAIIVGESIYYRRSRGDPPKRAAIDGSMRVAWPVIAAVVTTMIAFLPLGHIGGMVGKMIGQMPGVVILALAVSLIEALVILPAHLNHLPPIEQAKLAADGVRGWTHELRRRIYLALDSLIEKVYRPLLGFQLQWRYVTLAGSLAVLMLTVGLIQGGIMKFRFFPEMDSDWVVAEVEFPSGTPLSTTGAALEQMSNALSKVADQLVAKGKIESGEHLIKGIMSNAGAGLSAGPHRGQMTVELIPGEQRGVPSRDITTLWEKAIGEIPGAVSVNLNRRRHGPGGTPIEVWLLGEDLDALLTAAEGLKRELSEKEGVFQIEDDFRPGRRELRVRIKPEAHTLGLTSNDIGRQLRQGFYGDEPLRIQRGRDELRIRVLYPFRERRLLADVESIRIRAPDGGEIPLLSVADVSLERGYASITRKDGKRRVRVTADVDFTKANAEEILAELEQDGFLSTLSRDYPGMTASVEGQKKDRMESFGSLAVGFPLALLAIFMILATIFRSYIQPLVIMFTIPFGVIGALFGHLLLGYTLTIMSMFGIVALSGIVVNDAIVLIEQVNHYLGEGRSLRDSIIDAGCRRFRAVMLTTATTCGGLTPIIIERDFQAQFLKPMALSIAAGVVFATVLTLVLIPCLLAILSDLRRAGWWLRHGHAAAPEALEPATRRNSNDEE